MEAWST